MSFPNRGAQPQPTDEPIPESVLTVLEAIRAEGQVNMADRRGVIFLAEMAFHFEEALWLTTHRDDYLRALREVGRRRDPAQRASP